MDTVMNVTIPASSELTHEPIVFDFTREAEDTFQLERNAQDPIQDLRLLNGQKRQIVLKLAIVTQTSVNAEAKPTYASKVATKKTLTRRPRQHTTHHTHTHTTQRYTHRATHNTQHTTHHTTHHNQHTTNTHNNNNNDKMFLLSFPSVSQSLTFDVSSVVGAPWRCGVLTTKGGKAGMKLGHLLGREHDSTLQSGG